MTVLTGRRLAPDQELAAAEIISAWKESRHIAFIGPAGCGKTTTIVAAIQQLQRTKPPQGVKTGVLLMAPSHKALRVLKGQWRGIKVTFLTTQKFSGVRAKPSFDTEKFGIFSPCTAQDRAIRFIRDNRIGLAIIDECSMLARDQAAIIEAACRYGGAAVAFTGDPYQLPPVSNDEPEGGDDGPEYLPDPSGMAPQFLSAPSTIRLETVHRYDGPIYKYATSIRENWDRLAMAPRRSEDGGGSRICVVDHWQIGFIEHARQTYERLGGSPAAKNLLDQMPRALAYTNATVDSLTLALRVRLFGPEARERFMRDELISFPEYTVTYKDPEDQPELDPDVIHSSTDAVVLESRIVEVNEPAPAYRYKTEKLGIEREIPLSLSGRFQELTVQLIDADNSICKAGWGIQTVRTPIIGDTETRAQYSAMKTKLLRVKIKEDDDGWAPMKRWKTYFTRINSAFVMTVHKSQGSTFRHVYVSDDISRERDRLKKNPLLYVSATRASESITFER